VFDFMQGVHRNPDASTKDFIMQQTMLRITVLCILCNDWTAQADAILIAAQVAAPARR
jgi:hypothetical protein